jgi:hypothetical protein
MSRLAILALPMFLAACAASRTNAVLVSDSTDVRASSTSVAPPPEARTTVAPSAALLEPVATAPAPLALAPAEESLHSSRFTVKGGYYGSEEDALDDGYIFNVSWMRFMSSLLAIELEVGYFDADGSDGGVDAEVWSVPIMLNGRLNLPIWILDLYGGLGVGTFYYDAEASGGGLSDDDDGFLLGGNAFVGATVNLADAIALGLEGKYYTSEDIDDFDASLDAFAVMLTLGFSR